MPHSPEENEEGPSPASAASAASARGLERALEAGADCAPVLQQIAAIRGAVNGLMSEVLEVAPARTVRPCRAQ